MEPSNKESARLVKHLLSTLDADEETTSEELWMEEAERRHADYRAGRIASKTAEQILREPGTKLTSTAFLGPAEAEMVGAAEFYESQGSGLGKDFLDEVQRSVELITQNPRSGSLVRAEIRRRFLRRLPFGILYRIDSEEIVIAAVMHLRIRPGYW